MLVVPSQHQNLLSSLLSSPLSAVTHQDKPIGFQKKLKNSHYKRKFIQLSQIIFYISVTIISRF